MITHFYDLWSTLNLNKTWRRFEMASLALQLQKPAHELNLKQKLFIVITAFLYGTDWTDDIKPMEISKSMK